MFFFKFLAFTALVVAAPEPIVDRRTGNSKSCNHDNLLRELVDSRYSSSASVFCSSFLSLPARSTTTTTQTIQTAPPIVTSTVVVPSTTTYDSSAASSFPLQSVFFPSGYTDTVVTAPLRPPLLLVRRSSVKNGKNMTNRGIQASWPVLLHPHSESRAPALSLSLSPAVRTATATTTLTTGVASTTTVTSLGPAQTVITTVCPIVMDATITTTTTPISTLAAVTVNSITTVTTTVTIFTSTVTNFLGTGYQAPPKRAVNKAPGPLQPRTITLTCPTPTTLTVTSTAPTSFVTPTVTSFGTETTTSTLATDSITTRRFLFPGQCIAFGQPCPANGGSGGSTRCCQSALGICANPLGPGNVGVCVPSAQATRFFPPNA